MGLLTKALSPSSRPSVSLVPGKQQGITSGSAGYLTYARQGYAGNEIVFSAIELLATSAAEPHIIGKRWRRNKRTVSNPMNALSVEWDRASVVDRAKAEAQIEEERRRLNALGIFNRAGRRMLDRYLVHNGYVEEVFDHPLIRILNNPNPFLSRGQLWSTIVMDLKLAGNAYVYKARYTDGLLRGAVGELWRLRPDRVRVVPASDGQVIAGYTYTVDGQTVTLPAADVMHFKTRNPFDDYYGMPPLMPIMGRISIDNYMRGFLAAFYETGGTGPGAILSVKGEMSQKDKEDLRDRNRRQFGPGNFLELMILDNAEAVEYTPMSLNRGLRDALPQEINAMSESRIAMVFGIPGSILGLLIGYETSSYANKRQDWQVLWDIVMTPLLSDMDDVMNLSLVPEFAGIDEVCFDLSDIRALQEDIDALHKRARDNVVARIWTLEEAREFTGKGAVDPDGHFLLPDGSAVRAGDLNQQPELVAAGSPAALITQAVAMIAAPRVGRTRLEDDPEAQADYERALELKARYPGMTWAQIASRIGRSERQLRELRNRFSDLEDEE